MTSTRAALSATIAPRIARNGAALALVASILGACDDPVDPPSPAASALLKVVDAEVRGVVGTPPDPQPAVRVVTPEGDALAGVDVLWWHGAPPERVTHITTTNPQGVASADWTLGRTAGQQEITARLGNGAEVTIAALAEPGPVRVIEATERLLAEVGASAPAGIRFEDAFGNEVPTSQATWSVASSDLASVDGAGVVTGLALGATELRVEADDTAAVLPLEVRPILRLAQIAAGFRHACGLTEDNAAFCWGPTNSSGELGAGHNEPVDGAVGVLSPEPIAALSLGDRKSCALSVSGNGYCWGDRSNSLLGDGASGFPALHEPHPIALDLPLVSLEASLHHTQCAITTEGEAYCWGHNDFGQVGQGFESGAVPTPEVLPVDGVVRDIALSAFHGCALNESGKAWCWGQGADVGRGADDPSVQVPAPVSGDETFVELVGGWSGTCGLTADGNAFCWGAEPYMTALAPEEEFRVPTPLGDFRFDALALGAFAACAVADTGPLCWTHNTPPAPAPVSGVTQFALGWIFICALDAEGAPWCWSIIEDDDFPETPVRIYAALPPG